MSPERFFFCHIPKTGGTSTMAAVVREFGEEAVYPLPGDENPEAVIDVDHLRTVFEARGHEIRVVAGHFPLCVAGLLGEPFRTFTILREPVARTLSHIRFQRLIDPRFAAMSAEEAYAQPTNLFGAIHNQMVKMLGMTTDELTAGALSFVDCQEEHLQRAQEALDRMEVVGVQADFDGFIADLGRTFGWDVGEPVHVNTTEREPVNEEFAWRIARDSSLDVQLHDYARDLVKARAAGASGVPG